MWSLLSRKWQLTIVIAVGIMTAWSIDAIWSMAFGNGVGLIKAVSLTVAVISFIAAIVLETTWRRLWKKFPAIGVRTFPDLNGVWKGSIVSTWIDPETGNAKPPIPTEIVIRQGLFSTHVSLKTGESTSHSTRSFLEPFHDTHRYRIWYSYNNDPKAQVQHRSSPHEGVAFLELDLDVDPHRLAGRYYTARKTTGDIEVSRI